MPYVVLGSKKEKHSLIQEAINNTIPKKERKETNMNNFEKNVYVLTHTDLDGYMSGAIAADLLVNLGYDKNQIGIMKMFPSNEVRIPDECIFLVITDFSISNPYTLDNIHEFLKRGGRLWWFDHHNTSLEVLKNNPWLEEQAFCFIETKVSGTMLIYMMAFEAACQKGAGEHQWASNFLADRFNLEKAKYNVIDLWLGTGAYRVTKLIPKAVRLTNDWDIFELQIPESQYLNSAFYTLSIFPNDLMGEYYRSEVSPFTLNKLRNEGKNMPTKYTDYFVEYGKEAINWQRYMYLNAVMKYGFVCNIDSPDPNIRKIDLLGVNRSDFNMQNGFLRDTPEYLYGINFNFAGERGFTSTVYCSDPEHVKYTAEDICKSVGGGGHPGCSGFGSSRLKLINIRKMPKTVRDRIQKIIDEIAPQLGPDMSPAMREALMKDRI